MNTHLRPALVLFILLTLLTGVVYPLLVTLIAQGVFPHQANGSLVKRGDEIIGSGLIGQSFDDPKYFWGRPSATLPVPYTAFNKDTLTGSTGSNLGPTNPALVGGADVEKEPGAVRDRVKAMKEAYGSDAPVPIDLVTASASGLDPHISPAAAEYQVARVAKHRPRLTEATVRKLVADHTEGRTLGLMGEPRVNVLRLNLALDRM